MIDRESVSRWGSSWPRVLVAAVLGAVAFVTAQRLKGYPVHIAEFVGDQIVAGGGYPEATAGFWGWGVHLSVSLAYAALFGFMVSCSFLHGSKLGPRLTGLMLVPILGYLSTAVAAPAIAVTVALLSGSGLPAAVPPFNLQLDFVFWNHALFFLVCWATFFTPVGRRRVTTEGADVLGDRLRDSRDGELNYSRVGFTSAQER